MSEEQLNFELVETPPKTEYDFRQIYPNQVIHFWNDIRSTIVESLRAVSDDISEAEIAHVQAQIMSGGIRVFGLIKRGNELKMEAIFLATITNDVMLFRKSLVILGAKSFGKIPGNIWDKIVEGAINIGRSLDCHYLTAMTNDRIMIAVGQRNGFDCSVRFCKLQIGA